MQHSEHNRSLKANLEFEKVAGHLALARWDLAAGVPGAGERCQYWQGEFDRLRARPTLPRENTPE